MENENQLLTFKAAGKIAGVSEHTIKRWTDFGDLKVWPDPTTNRKRIRRKTLIEFIESREVSVKMRS